MTTAFRSVLAGIFVVAACTAAAAEPAKSTAKAINLPAFDFNHPPREYACRAVAGWNVHVEQQLLTEDAPTAAKALARLQLKLDEVAHALPPATLAELKQVNIYLMYGSRARGGGRNTSLEYFPPNAPRYSPHLDERMANSVVIFNAYNYVGLADLWAVKSLVHEFAHAYQLLHWGELEPGIYDAWAAAMKAGLYRCDAAAEGTDVATLRYAAQNHLEYFAELSAMYFVGCDYPPVNRAELKAYDPVGYAMIERYWGVAQPPPPDTRSPGARERTGAK